MTYDEQQLFTRIIYTAPSHHNYVFPCVRKSEFQNRSIRHAHISQQNEFPAKSIEQARIAKRAPHTLVNITLLEGTSANLVYTSQAVRVLYACARLALRGVSVYIHVELHPSPQRAAAEGVSGDRKLRKIPRNAYAPSALWATQLALRAAHAWPY